MADRAGYLTIFSADGSEIYGEFSDAIWAVEKAGDGTNNVFSGAAGDGTLETFRRLDEEGISYVTFAFESGGERFSGGAQLLAPIRRNGSGPTIIRVETATVPSKAAYAG